MSSVVGTERRVPQVGPDGVSYTASVPAPVRNLEVSFRLDEARDALTRLNNVAAKASPRGGRTSALLGVECLPSKHLRDLVAGKPIRAKADADRLVERFERGCVAGVRADRLDEDVLMAAHRRIVPGGGTVRDCPVWVGGLDLKHAGYVGPPADQVRRLLADLVGFLDRDDVCPVVQAAVAYAQLQSVHPFRDGNGRMGRWLLQVVPRRRGVARSVCPPMGLFFVANTDVFLARLNAFRDGDAWAWCEFFGDAVVQCAAAAEQVMSGPAAAGQSLNIQSRSPR
jgi:hypothetical protein